MSSKSDATTARVHVTTEINHRLEMAHFRVMTHCGRRIPKLDFMTKVLEIGLDNEESLYEAFEARRKVS